MGRKGPHLAHQACSSVSCLKLWADRLITVPDSMLQPWGWGAYAKPPLNSFSVHFYRVKIPVISHMKRISEILLGESSKLLREENKAGIQRK